MRMKDIIALVWGLVFAIVGSAAQDVVVLDNPQILSPNISGQSYGYSVVFSNDTLFVSGASTKVESIVDSYLMTHDGAKKLETVKEGGVQNRKFFGFKICASGGRLGVLASTAKYFYLFDKTSKGVSSQPSDSIKRTKSNLLLDLDGNYFASVDDKVLNVYKLMADSHERVFTFNVNVDAPCVLSGNMLGCVGFVDSESTAVADTVLFLFEENEGTFVASDTVSLSGYGGIERINTIGIDMKGNRIAVGLSTGCYKVLIIDKLSSGWEVTHVIDSPANVTSSWGFSLSFSDENTLAIGSNKNGDGYIYKFEDEQWQPAVRLITSTGEAVGYAVAFNGEYFVATDILYKGTTNDLTNCGGAYLYNVKNAITPITDIKVDLSHDDGLLYDLKGRRVNDSYKGLVVGGGRLILKR